MSTDFRVIPQKRLGDLCITLKLNIFYNMTQPGGGELWPPSVVAFLRIRRAFSGRRARNKSSVQSYWEGGSSEKVLT